MSNSKLSCRVDLTDILFFPSVMRRALVLLLLHSDGLTFPSPYHLGNHFVKWQIIAFIWQAFLSIWIESYLRMTISNIPAPFLSDLWWKGMLSLPKEQWISDPSRPPPHRSLDEYFKCLCKMFCLFRLSCWASPGRWKSTLWGLMESKQPCHDAPSFHISEFCMSCTLGMGIPTTQ